MQHKIKGHSPAGAVLQENLLTVRMLLHRNYQPYASLLAAEYQPAADWLNRELLPTLVILPGISASGDNSSVCNLALALELSFLAGRVHDLTAAQPAQGDMERGSLTAASRAILVGDYLYTLAASKIAQGGYNQWLGKVGRTICRRSEAKLMRLRWQTRPFVAESERIANLHKEHAEGMALAAEMAVCQTDWPEKERQAWTEFGFYVGLAQGILLHESGAACAEAVMQAEQALGGLSGQLQNLAQSAILSRLLSGQKNQRKEYEKAVK